ncbi:MAG: hypothetical protein NVSMB38_33710 [Ktedonobacteraceae bacterium]
MKFLFGLLLGIGVGVAAGLIFAPQSGEATRAQLEERGIMLRSGTLNDDIRTRANAALEQGRELYNRTKIELSDRYAQTKSGNL